MPDHLADLIDAFLARLREQNRSPLTIKRYGDELRRLLAFRRGLAAGTATLEHVDVIAYLRRVPMQAPATRNARLTALRRFFGFASKHGIGDPTAGLDFARLPRRVPSYLSRSDYARLREAIALYASDHYRARDLAILVTFWNTG